MSGRRRPPVALSIKLCALEDIPDGTAKGFTIDEAGAAGEEGEETEIFVVRLGEAVHGYRNFCPHIGSPLDWKPDSFMSDDGKLLRCATHGALFRPEDGYCVEGPCEGDSLRRVEVILEDGEVVLTGL